MILLHCTSITKIENILGQHSQFGVTRTIIKHKNTHHLEQIKAVSVFASYASFPF
jgi:hypothetical protein